MKRVTNDTASNLNYWCLTWAFYFFLLYIYSGVHHGCFTIQLSLYITYKIWKDTPFIAYKNVLIIVLPFLLIRKNKHRPMWSFIAWAKKNSYFSFPVKITAKLHANPDLDTRESTINYWIWYINTYIYAFSFAQFNNLFAFFLFFTKKKKTLQSTTHLKLKMEKF